MRSGARQLLLGGWTPRSLFGNTQGAWYDPSDLSSMFQDSAGTTPCAVGSPVGLRLDKSGRGNHASQATAASRPTLRVDTAGRFYLEYDGVDDGMATGNVDFTGTDKMTVFAGVHKASDAAAGFLLEFSTTGANPGAFGVQAPTTGGGYRFEANRGGVILQRNVAGFAAPISAIVSCGFDVSGAAAASAITPRINGAVPATTDSGLAGAATTFISAPLFIGRRAGTSIPFNGRDYGLIVLGRSASATEIAKAERWLAAKAGITL